MVFQSHPAGLHSSKRCLHSLYEKAEEKGGFEMMAKWKQLYDEELKLYDENEDAHFECTTCHKLMPNAAPPFIPLLIAIECFECYSKRMEASR